MPYGLNRIQIILQAGVALSIFFFAALSQIASAQSVAPESDPFAAIDPFASNRVQPLRSPIEPAVEKKQLTISPPVSSKPLLLTQLPVPQLGASKPGGPIASVPSDPYMTAEQEARIIAALQVHDDTDWDGISLKDLKALLKNRLPVRLNRTEIGVVGIEVDAALENGSEVAAGPLGARLNSLLAESGLSFSIRANRLEISSTEDIDSLTNIRVYDVTPLVLRMRGGKRVFDFESLTNLIQMAIDPDSWLQAGGTNVISSFIAGEPGAERSLLVVTAPSSTQLQLQPLLDRLNIPGSPSPNAVKHY